MIGVGNRHDIAKAFKTLVVVHFMGYVFSDPSGFTAKVGASPEPSQEYIFVVLSFVLRLPIYNWT